MTASICRETASLKTVIKEFKEVLLFFSSWRTKWKEFVKKKKTKTIKLNHLFQKALNGWLAIGDEEHLEGKKKSWKGLPTYQ